MKRIVLVLALGCIALLAPSAHRTSADTTSPSTATPTPTATETPSTYPSAADLLDRDDKAMTAENSFHADMTMKMNMPGVLTMTMLLHVDTSAKPSLTREVGTMTGKGTVNGKPKTLTSKLTLDEVGQRVAMRIGKKKWQCTTQQALEGSSAGSTLPTTGSSQDEQNAVTVGPDTVRGIAVWHVHLDMPVDTGSLDGSTTGTQSQTMPTDVYISQSDYTLVRMSAKFDDTSSGATIHESVLMDLSKYGEKVSVTLPKACRAKA